PPRVDLGDEVPRRRDVRHHRAPEAADRRLERVAPVEHHDVVAALVDEVVQRLRAQPLPAADHTVLVDRDLVRDAERHELGPHLDGQAREVATRAVRPLHVDPLEPRVPPRRLHVLLEVLDRPAERRVDAVLGHDHAAREVPALPQRLLPQLDRARVRQGREGVEEHDLVDGHAHQDRDGYRARRTRSTSHTGSGASTTSPSAPNTRKRSNPRANHRSWVTASTVPWKAARPASSASAECRSRLSVGSSRSSSVAPSSSSRRIWKRACCPPESVSKRCSACPTSSYRSSARLASARRLPARGPSPRWRISRSVRPRSSGWSWCCASQPGRTREPSTARPVCATGSGAAPSCTVPGSGSLPPAASRRRKCDLPEPFEPSTATRSPKNTSTSNGFMSPVSSSRSHVTARLAVRSPVSRTVTFWSRATTSGRPASSNLRRRVRAAW